MSRTKKRPASPGLVSGPVAELTGAQRASLPRKPAAQLATLVQEAPAGDDWLHELKFDGYRILARVESGLARLWTRNGNDWTERFGVITAAVERLGLESAVLDGEVVVQLPDGRSSFQALQNAGSRADLLYYVFDMLYLDGFDLTGVQQVTRKNALLAVLQSGADSSSPVRYSDHVLGHGPEFLRHACAAGLEGIVSKRVSGRYRAGRGGSWVKVKCLREQEFVVVGYTAPAGSRQDVGALLVASYEAAGLTYRGKVGTGFSGAVLRDLRRQLEPLRRPGPPLESSGMKLKGVSWVQPEVVVQVAFSEVTSDGVLRHPSFRGVRADKPAREVTLERPSTGGTSDAAPPAPARARQPEAASRSTRGGAVTALAGVRISNPDKVLYPERGLTKEAVARYYMAVADWLMPHIRGRPLTLVRCPQGHQGDCFFQKHMDEVDSPHVHRVRVKEAEGARDYGTVSDIAGVLAVVQLGALELHTWNSRADRLEYPDRFVLDIDPDPTVTWGDTVQAALEIRALLLELDLECFVKTTGGKGLHVVVPLVRRSGWNEVRDCARAVAATVAAASPGRYTLQLSKARRKGKLLLDYLRNTRGATAVEVYSTRARPGAPVSAPVSWEELSHGLDPGAFTIETVPARLAGGTDPWRDYGAVKQSLTAPLKKRLGLR